MYRNDGQFVGVLGNRPETSPKGSICRRKSFRLKKMESLGRLAGGIAHDYNNVSSVIIGYAELVLESLEQDDPLFDYALEIYRAAERSTKFTRQLLAFARRQNAAPKVIDLNETIGAMIKMLHRLIGEHLTLSWDPNRDLWPIKIDHPRLTKSWPISA